MRPLVRVLLAVAPLLLLGCPEKPPCSPATCPSGCCDISGACVVGQTPTSCGSNGLTCSVCGGSQVCLNGLCTSLGGGGSGGTGGLAGSGGAGGTGGTGAETLAQVARSYCTWMVTCGVLDTTHFTVDRCVQAVIPSLFGFAGLAAAFGAASVDTALAARCSDAITSTACGSSPRFSACANIVTPTAGLGQRCAGACREGYCPSNVCNATCVAGGTLGQPCRYRDSSATWCDTGLACDPDGVCVAAKPLGATCGSARECGDTAVCPGGVCIALPGPGQRCGTSFPQCLPTAFCNSGSCEQRRQQNTSCSYDSQCAEGLFCSPSLLCAPKGSIGARCRYGTDCVSSWCDAVLRTCRAAPVYAGLAGQSCTTSGDCVEGLVCRGLVVNADGGIGTGGSCGTPQAGDRCSVPSDCPPAHHCPTTTTRVCTPSTVGSPCGYSSSACRSSEYCNSSSACAPRYASGQPCDPSHSESCASPSEACTELADGGAICRTGRLGQNEPCANSSSCKYGLNCIAGRCALAGVQGLPCLSFGCLDGNCRPDAGPQGVCGPPGVLGEACPSSSSLSATSCAAGLTCRSGTCQTSCP